MTIDPDSSRLAGRVRKSRFFRRARQRASEIAGRPERLNDLVGRAAQKAQGRKGALAEVWDSLMTFLRMLGAYARGDYRDVSWKTIVAVTGAVVYFLMPLDFIPDMILGLGFADDVTVIAWTVRSIKSDIKRFEAWEAGQSVPAENQS